MATHSSILACRIPMDRGAWWAAVHGVTKVGHDSATKHSTAQHGTTDWFRIEKAVRQGCLLSPRLFNLYYEHIMRNARLDELQAGIKIGGRNMKNLQICG